MKTLAYFECSTGIAGDMCLGALIHAGVPLAYLKAQLDKLGIHNEFELRAELVLRNQQSATKAHVRLLDHAHHSHQHPDHHHSHRHGSRRLPEIKALISQAELPERVGRWSLAIFQQLAEAEAAVHGIAPEQVHFHEVGATDAIVDIVGTCLGLDWLNVDRLICSPLPTGGGTVRCEHGLLSVPAPAVLNMMARAQVPVYSNGIEKELVTPTGCAIATTLAESFGAPPRFTLQKVGLGAGGRNLPLPNILRLWIGTIQNSEEDSGQEDSGKDKSHHHAQSQPQQSQPEQSQPEQSQPDQHTPATETIVELQTQIDDCSPQAIGYVYEQLFAVGALDVFSQAAAMKKNRLGTLVTVLCPLDIVAQCEMILFQETTTLGIRRTVQARTALNREIIAVATPYGAVMVKVARLEGSETVVNVHPEYEDCAKIARSHNIPWQQAHQAALSAANALLQKPKSLFPNGLR